MRQLKLILMVLLGYLVQVSIMPYLQVNGVTPSMLMAMIAIVTVGYSLFHGLWTGMVYGIVMETMLPTVPMLNLLFYPIVSLLCGAIFSDKSESRLQYERSAGRRGRNVSPLLRTVLCAMLGVAIYEVVNLVYMYLSGAVITAPLIRRGLTDVLASTALTALIMVPVRKLLGFRRKEAEHQAELRFDHRPERD